MSDGDEQSRAVQGPLTAEQQLALRRAEERLAVQGMHKVCGDPDCTERAHDRANISVVDWEQTQRQIRILQETVERLARGETVGRLL